MISRLIYLLLMISIVSISNAQKVSNKFVRQVEMYYQKYASGINNASVVVGLYDQGADSIICYGRINRFGRKANENDLYQIGSLTKTFTGLMFARAVSSGELKFSDKLSNHMEIRHAHKYDRTTLLQLATHTSGLPNNTITFYALPFLSYVPLSLSKRYLLEAVNAPQIWIDLPWQILLIPPPIPYFSTYGRTWVNFDLNIYSPKEKYIGRWKYSNLGMGMLGRVVAETKGMSYEDLLQNQICRPLGMTSTSTEPSKDLRKKYATPHNMLGIRVLRTKFRKGGIEGAGGIKSTGKDLMKYLRLQFSTDTSNLLVRSIDMQQNTYFRSKHPKRKGMEMGLGWIKYNPDNDPGTTIVWHSGQLSGSSSFMAFIPEKQLGIFILSNSPRSRKLTRDGFRILNHMQEKSNQK